MNPSARGLSVSSARSGMTSGSRKSDAEDDSVGSDLDEVTH